MRTFPAILTAAVVLACAQPSGAGETATAGVSVHVQIASRTSLNVSTDVLHFDVLPDGAPALATVDFSAGARVPRHADVVLTIEPQRAIQAGGPVEGDTAITFEGEGDGTVAGALVDRVPVVAGRWQGSGVRHGRVRFTIRTNAAGDYVVPVRFVLSTP